MPFKVLFNGFINRLYEIKEKNKNLFFFNSDHIIARHFSKSIFIIKIKIMLIINVMVRILQESVFF